MFARVLALVALVVGLFFTAPSTANAESRSYYGCSSSHAPALHLTATRIWYSTGRTAIYASATQSYKQVLSLKPDVVWTFHHFQSTGLQTRYVQPTQWGSSANPINGTYARWVYAYWTGRNSGGGTYSTYCRAAVGVGAIGV